MSSDATSLDETSSDEGSELLLRPVYLKKTKAAAPKAAPVGCAANVAISKAEFQAQLESKEAKNIAFSGIDDTDDVEPEREYGLWRLREQQRRERDRHRLEQLETEKEDVLRRKQGVVVVGEPGTAGSGHTRSLGSFYADDVDETLLKRNYDEMEDLGDHSRPTRFKQSGKTRL